MNAFAKLKASRKSQFNKILEEAEKLNTNQSAQSKDDDRFWKPTQDKMGNGYAVVRFLPAPEADEPAWERVFSHGFKGPTGSWYIENSLTTLGETDPVGEYNTKLWNSGNPKDKDKARDQKRRLKFYSNVLVVKDPAHPENEGKVFIYGYGKKIFDHLKSAWMPEFDDEGRSQDHADYNPSNAFNPFDMWEGANFIIKIRKVEGYPNYDRSEFANPAPIADSDEEIEEIFNKTHSLKFLVDKSNFKTYDELSAKLARVMGWDRVPEETLVKETAEPEEPRKSRVKESSAPWDEDEEDFDSVLASITGDDD